MSELLPLPHSPVTAMVSGGSVWRLRRNREIPRAMPPRSSASRSPGRSGRSEAKRSVTETVRRSIGTSRHARRAPTKPNSKAAPERARNKVRDSGGTRPAATTRPRRSRGAPCLLGLPLPPALRSRTRPTGAVPSVPLGFGRQCSPPSFETSTVPKSPTASARSAFAKATDRSVFVVSLAFGCHRSPPSVDRSTVPPAPTASVRWAFAKATDQRNVPGPLVFGCPALAPVG